MKPRQIKIIGGGLAGCEAALTLSRFDVPCILSEMRPAVPTPAHRTANLAELVCSNSLGSLNLDTAKGLLLCELEMAGAILPRIFREYAIPAGQAFAIDTALASSRVTEEVEKAENIELIREEVVSWPEGPSIIASGPLSSDAFLKSMHEKLGGEFLHFFDAISPSVFLDSIDLTQAFFASRYDKGGKDYLNIPLDKNEYDLLVDNLLSAERVEIREYEPDKLFEACLPVEVIASRGRDSLRFGPMKPKGLDDPRTGRMPYAVIQLRRETIAGETYNLVGFQTRLKHDEQKRVLTMIPALKEARFSRLGSMHLNAYLNSPSLLNADMSLKDYPDVFLAGQISGGEGYLEAIATGFYAALNQVRKISGLDTVTPPADTMSGALIAAITSSDPAHFQPVQAQFGLMPPLQGKIKGKRERAKVRVEAALISMGSWLKSIGVEPQVPESKDDD